MLCSNLNFVFLKGFTSVKCVIEMMNEYNSMLGGENSGHIICLDKTTTGDGIIAALQIVAEMQKTGLSLHDLKSGMQKYPQVLINVRTAKKVDLNHVGIQNAVRAVEQALGDKGRVLLRASGTEPLIRVMVEGLDFATVDNYAKQLSEDVQNAITV